MIGVTGDWVNWVTERRQEFCKRDRTRKRSLKAHKLKEKKSIKNHIDYMIDSFILHVFVVLETMYNL